MIDSVALTMIGPYADQEILLTPGVNVLSAPSGSGKSTVLRAIGLALSGELDRTFRKFIRRNASGGAISVKLSSGQQVNRSLGSTSMWQVIEEDVVIAEGSRAVVGWLEEYFGLESSPLTLTDLWRNTIYIPQFEVRYPFGRPPSVRKVFFESAMGVDVYELAWRKMGQVYRELEAQGFKKQGEFDRLSKFRKLADQIDEIQYRLGQLEASLVNLRQACSDLESEKISLDKELATSESRLERLESWTEMLDGGQCPVCQQQVNIKVAERHLRTVEDVTEHLRDLNRSLLTTNQLFAAASKTLALAEKEQNQLKGKLQGLNANQIPPDLEDKIKKVKGELGATLSAKGKAELLRPAYREAAPKLAGRLVEIVSHEANKLFSAMWQHRNGSLKWKADYGLDVHLDGFNHGWPSGGGEQVSAALALRLALASELGDGRLLIVDEPTMGAIDAETARYLPRMLQEIKVGQMIVVDHGGHLIEIADNLIKIKNEGGVASVVSDL